MKKIIFMIILLSWMIASTMTLIAIGDGGTGTEIVSISSGGFHSSALTADGDLWMWGYDGQGQIGDGGTNSDKLSPLEITSQFTINEGEKIVGVSLGFSHSSAWTSDGEVWMWGSDTYGQLGDGGTNTEQGSPVNITSQFTINEGEKIVGVSLGFSHSSAWTSDGEVWMWGRDNDGQLGDGGTNTEQGSPVNITSQFTINEGEKIVGISLGTNHSSAWTSDGEVWMWGSNYYGQLGHGGTNADQASPLEITSQFTINEGEKIVGVSLGANHSSAWTSDGEVWMWGSDKYGLDGGLLGDGGTNTEQENPVNITSNFTINEGEKIVGVALGTGHSSAWTSDGEVWMWGVDNHGQLGDGSDDIEMTTPANITSKFALSSPDTTSEISLGFFHSVSVTDDGDLWTWGDATFGQLGDGQNSTYRNEPYRVFEQEGTEPLPSSYTMTFETNGGSIIAPIVYAYGDETEAPPQPTKESYTFFGWYSNEELTLPYVFTTMPDHDVTLYAKWQEHEELSGDQTTIDYESVFFDYWFLAPLAIVILALTILMFQKPKRRRYRRRY